MTTTKIGSLYSYRDVKEGQVHFIFLQIPLSHSKPWKSTSFQKFQPQTNKISSELISNVNKPNFLRYYMPSANKSRNRLSLDCRHGSDGRLLLKMRSELDNEIEMQSTRTNSFPRIIFLCAGHWPTEPGLFCFLFLFFASLASEVVRENSLRDNNKKRLRASLL